MNKGTRSGEPFTAWQVACRYRWAGGYQGGVWKDQITKVIYANKDEALAATRRLKDDHQALSPEVWYALKVRVYPRGWGNGKR